MIKILLVGANGFIGQHVNDYFQYIEDFEIFDSRNYGLDLGNPIKINEVIKLIQPDHLINLGALASIESNNFDLLYTINSFSILYILNALSEINFEGNFINASSAYVYGDQTPSILFETSPLNPKNHYACSKVLAERFCEFDHKIKTINLRFFNVIGPGQKPYFVIPKIISHFVNKSKSIELGNINSVRDFIDIRDVVSLIHVLITKGSLPKVLNVSNGKGISLGKIIDKFIEVSNHPIEVRFDDNIKRSSDNLYMVGSEKLRNEIGHRSQYELIDSVEWILKEYKAIPC